MMAHPALSVATSSLNTFYCPLDEGRSITKKKRKKSKTWSKCPVLKHTFNISENQAGLKVI